MYLATSLLTSLKIKSERLWVKKYSFKVIIKQVIEVAERDNVGMVIDFLHLWSVGERTPDEVVRLCTSIIYSIHFCERIRHVEGKGWAEEDLRGFLAGDGDIPIREWVKAVQATGFDGVYSSELLSPKHWERNLLEIARETKRRMEKYISLC